MFPKIDFLGTPTDTYALCILMSFLVIFISVLLLKPKEFPLKYVFWGIIIVFIFGYVGANLWNIITNIFAHRGQPLGQIFKASVMAYLGAPIVGLLALWIFCKNVKIAFPVVADYVAPFLILERVIGRIGCLGYGCCYGIPSNLPWAYPFNVWGITNVVPRHPTQAYAFISALAIFVSSRYLYKKAKNIPGVLGIYYKDAPLSGITFFYVFLCYGILRFFNELLRAEGPFVYGPIKLSYIVVLIFAVISAIGLFIII